MGNSTLIEQRRPAQVGLPTDRSSIPRQAWVEGLCSDCGNGWQCPANDLHTPVCRSCGAQERPLKHEHVDARVTLRACLVCGHDQMYWARDFPRRLGILIVIIAAVLAPFTYYISLAVGAVLDASLVFVVRKRLHCYACKSVHHGFDGADLWRPFDLEVRDVHEFGERAAVVQALSQQGGGDTRHVPRAYRKDRQDLPSADSIGDCD